MASKHKIQQQRAQKGNKKIAIYVIIAIVAAVIVYSISTRDSGPGPYDEFAQCLTEKGAIMYGAYWCSHCKEQKDEFGKSFQYVNYVECEQDKETCLREGIKGYPTWKFADGSEQSGKIPLVSLSQRTGCPLSGPV